jgi:endonuclease III
MFNHKFCELSEIYFIFKAFFYFDYAIFGFSLEFTFIYDNIFTVILEFMISSNSIDKNFDQIFSKLFKSY